MFRASCHGKCFFPLIHLWFIMPTVRNNLISIDRGHVPLVTRGLAGIYYFRYLRLDLNKDVLASPCVRHVWSLKMLQFVLEDRLHLTCYREHPSLPSLLAFFSVFSTCHAALRLPFLATFMRSATAVYYLDSDLTFGRPSSTPQNYCVLGHGFTLLVFFSIISL